MGDSKEEAAALIREDLEPILYELFAKSFPSFSAHPAKGIYSFGDPPPPEPTVAEATEQVWSYHRRKLREAKQAIDERLKPGEELVAVAIKGVDGQIRTENVE